MEIVRHAAVLCGHRPRRRGFTIIELLVVVSIIAILIAILLPSLGRARQLAAEVECQSNLRHIGTAIRSYMNDYNGRVPVTTGFEEGPDAAVPPSAWFRKLETGGYIDNAAAFACPSDPARRFFVANPSFGISTAGAIASSYGLNEFIQLSTDQELANLERYPPKRPHETLLIGDTGPDVVFSGAGGPKFEGENRRTGVLPWDDGYEPGDPTAQLSWLTARHQGGINVLTAGFGVHNVATRMLMGQVIQPSYSAGLSGGCTLCFETIPHYSFAASQTYWYTGPVPTR